MTTENSKPTKTATNDLNVNDLFGSPTKIESELAKVTPEDAAASSIEQVSFQFRDLLETEKRGVLAERAPVFAQRMIEDHNQILTFGSSVLDKMNQTSTRILEGQKNIKVPEMDELVNGTLRELDGFKKKYKNAKVESGASKIAKFFKVTKYSLEAMVRETKPLVERINMIESKLRVTENELRENVIRGQELHSQTLEGLKEVIDVLAALEEIQEVVRKEFNEASELMQTATVAEGETTMVTWKGEKITLNELNQIHQTIAEGMAEIEKTWFDWRQQFFIGYAQAPSVRNIASVSMQMQRHTYRFRTMALPAARQSLATLQQAVLLDEAVEFGQVAQRFTNQLMQDAYSQTGEIVKKAAEAAEAQHITPETVLVITESIQKQFDGIVEAAKKGREDRLKGLEIMAKSEQTINETSIEARKAMAAELMSAAQSNTNMIENNSGSGSDIENLFK